MPLTLHSHSQYALICSLAIGLSGMGGGVSNAQTGSAAAVATPGGQWSSLSKVQQTALAPLSATWPTLNDGQRRKWIAVAQNYGNLATADQEKMHSRMVDWAALTPKDRELARLNFAQTKSVGKPERAANWEAYQALSPEEKKKLAANAASSPTGAAVAPKPANREKLTQVPVTRRTPEDKKAAITPATPVNSNTLLPQKAAVVKDNSAPKAP
jgi:hypothetical protein